MDRDSLARAMYAAMAARSNQIEPGLMDPDDWDTPGVDAENCREVFRAGADCAIAALTIHH